MKTKQELLYELESVYCGQYKVYTDRTDAINAEIAFLEGKEEAQKEFLDILKKELNSYCLADEGDYSTVANMQIIFNNVKQSLNSPHTQEDISSYRRRSDGSGRVDSAESGDSRKGKDMLRIGRQCGTNGYLRTMLREGIEGKE